MEATGLAKIEKAQSTLESVRYCLQNNDYEQAKEFFYQLPIANKPAAVGLFRDFSLKPKENCPECGNALEFAWEDWHLRWRKFKCLNCRYKTVKKQLVDDCQQIMTQRGIAKRFLNASLDDFSENFRKQIKTDSGLYICGSPGTGKTHLMSALIKNDILNTEPAKCHIDGLVKEPCFELPLYSAFPLFISVPELLLKIRGTWNHSQTETSEEEIIDNFASAEILYMDDLGTEKASDWALQTIYLLIDRRYSEMLRTIISSNLSLDELAEHLGDRISSRIAGMTSVIKMEGKDRRLKN